MKTFPLSVRISRFQPAAVLKVGGEDALKFLQGQFTQELRTLEAGAQCYGLWLNQKGRVLADSFVFRGAGSDFWVVSYGSAARALGQRRFGEAAHLLGLALANTAMALKGAP